MNIRQITSDSGADLINAKLRAANRVNLDGYPMLDRARAALLSYAKSFEDWDQINSFFDELARNQPQQEPVEDLGSVPF
jgi:hypothetical protein